MSRNKNKKKFSGKPEDKSKPTGQERSSGSSTETNRTEDKAETKTNDPSWYERDLRLVVDTASIPFSEPLGSRIHLDANDPEGILALGTQVGDTTTSDEAVPGIMTLETLPSYGDAKDRLSPINVAATALYSHVRYVNNGRKNYDPADLFLMVASISELYSFINWCRRIYGCAFAYSQANFYIGKAMLEAQHIKPDSVLNNLANFRYWINTFTNKISSYAAPADIALFYRRAFQYSSVYKEHDSDSIKDQIYMYNPAGFYRFALDDDGKGMLEMVDVVDFSTTEEGIRYMTIEQIMNLGEHLLANIWADEDFGLMSGDIMKAFQGNILKLESLPEDFVIIPVHDKNVLTQMENTSITPATATVTVAGGPVGYVVGDDTTNTYYWRNVYQDVNGNLFSHWATEATIKGTNDQLTDGSTVLPLMFDKIITQHEATPSPESVIESIQNTVNAINGSRHDDFCKPFDLKENELLSDMYCRDLLLIEPGATVVTSVLSWEYSSKEQESPFAWKKLQEGAITPAIRTQSGLNELLTPYAWMKVLNFKYVPHLYAYTAGFEEENVVVERLVILSNLDVYAIVDRDQLHRMLEVSMLSLLYVPGVAKFVNSLS